MHGKESIKVPFLYQKALDGLWVVGENDVTTLVKLYKYLFYFSLIKERKRRRRFIIKFYIIQ